MAAVITPPTLCDTAVFAARDFRRRVHASATATAAPTGNPATEKLSTRTDEDILNMLLTGRIRLPQLEDKLGDFARAGVCHISFVVHMCVNSLSICHHELFSADMFLVASVHLAHESHAPIKLRFCVLRAVLIRRRYYKLQMDASDAATSSSSQDAEDVLADRNAGKTAAATAAAAVDDIASRPVKFQKTRSSAFNALPVTDFNADQFYRNVHGRNCESVVGYVPLPVGIVGPLRVDGKDYHVPMATTEGTRASCCCVCCALAYCT